MSHIFGIISCKPLNLSSISTLIIFTPPVMFLEVNDFMLYYVVCSYVFWV